MVGASILFRFGFRIFGQVTVLSVGKEKKNCTKTSTVTDKNDAMGRLGWGEVGLVVKLENFDESRVQLGLRSFDMFAP